MSDFILIPGAGGSAWYWHSVVRELRARGHDAIAVELPSADDSAGLADYADAVLEAVGGRDGVVLVAQSMGAFTAQLVCGRTSVRLLVLVNAMIPSPGESAGDWWANTGQPAAMREHAERIGIPGLAMDDAAALFGHDMPAEVFAEAGEHVGQQSGTPFAEPRPLSGWPAVPTRVLASRDDRLFPIEFQRRVALERLGIVADEMDGGHLVALSRPAELAERLDAYSREVV